jgi:hypothetical protein
MPLVGDPSLFAIEWQETWRDVTQVYGHYCLWVSGVRLGNYEDSISLRVPTGWLRNFLANADQHHIEFLDGASKEEIFAQVYDTVYSSGSRDHNWALFERMRDVWQLQDIWSLHSRLGRLHLSDIDNEAFDQVEIVLLDDHLRHTQRLIWRDRRDMQLYDGDLPDQVFASISREFLAACVMPVTLADLFSTSGDRPIEVDGRMVHRKFQRQLQGWMEVHLTLPRLKAGDAQAPYAPTGCVRA